MADQEPMREEACAPWPTPSRLEGRELNTFEELHAIDPKLADLFRTGLTLARSEHTPGLILMLAHAGRELSNGLLRRLDTTGSAQPSDRNKSCDEQSESQRDSIAQCVELPPDHPLVSRWLKLQRKLVAGAHYPHPSAGPSLDSVRDAFLELSDLLFGRIGPYFTTSAELDQLAALMSPSPADASRLQLLLARPQQRHHFFSNADSADWVDLLGDLKMFRSAPGRVVFSDGSWRMRAWPDGAYLARMAAARPDRVTTLLEAVPPSVDNPAVWMTIVDAALSLPGPYAARLGRSVAAALPNVPPFALPHKAIELVKHLAEQGERAAFHLANRLLDINEELPAAHAIRPRQLRRKGSAELLAYFDGYDLEVFIDKALPALTAFNGGRTVAMLAQRLDKLVTLAHPVGDDGTPVRDSSYRWCQSLSKIDMDDDVRGMFAFALARTAAGHAAESAAAARTVWTALYRYQSEVFDRVRLVALTAAGPFLQSALDAAIGHADILEPWDEAQERAALLRAQFANASPPARACLAQALERGPGSETLARMIENLRACRREDSNQRAPNDVEDTREALTSWQSHRLRWFHDRIPVELQPLAARIGLESRVPTPQEQALNEVGHYSSGMSWRSNRAPKSVEDLRAMSVAGIAEFLRAWQPTPRTDGDPYDLPSLAGLQDTLSVYSTAHPQQAAEILRIVSEARGRAGYLTALLAGLRKAAEAKTELPWNELIPIAASVIDRCTAESGAVGPEQGGIDDYGGPPHVRSWWQLFREAVDLITKGCNLNLIPYSEAGGIWSLTATAVRSPLPWTDVWNRGEVRTLNEAIMAGWNTAAGDAAELLVGVALWEFRNRVEKEVRPADRATRIAEVEDLAAPLLSEIVRHAGPVAAGPQAILGQYLPQVMLVAPRWFESSETWLLDTGDENPLIHPIWGAYLARATFYGDSFLRLRSHYASTAAAIPDGSIDVDEAHRETDGGATDGLVVKVMAAFIRGLAALGDTDLLVERTIGKASPKVLAHAYWQFFRGWSDQDEPVPSEVAERLIAFWTWRLQELESLPESGQRATEVEGLMWFLSTPFLPIQRAIALGRRTVALNTGKRRVTGNGWERMAELANADPDGAYALVELLVERELEVHGLVLFDQVAPALRVAMERGNTNTKSRAVRVINRLGEHNQGEFRKLLPGQ